MNSFKHMPNNHVIVEYLHVSVDIYRLFDLKK
jgi:hypothetical protein